MEETAEWHDGRWPSSEEAPMGGRLSLESRFPSFEEAIDVAYEMRQRRHARGKTLAMRAIAALLIVAAICIGGFPAMLQYRSARDLSGTSVRSAQTVAGWPYPQADDAFAAAQDYNKRLAESGQPILGEAKDPFADVRGGSRASVSDSGESDNEAGESGPQLSDSGESDNQSGAGTGADAGSADAGSASASSADAEYRSLLDSGGGVMGTIRIPKISVRLPIYHGTSESALASGAGHLYGSSLPVGGKSTHAVLTGHRGLVEAAMFTRLDEMRVGDYFYIEVMGRTFGYQVDRITVIEPNDTSQLKIVPGEDRVTLMTCTPYGVNTHRLLVSATRSAIPDEIPAENDAVKDARAIGAITGIATLVLGMLLVWLRRKPWHIRRHAAWWPKRG
ncbi:class C sortase [Bifidobacterium pseudocatenulatum]|uniref:class C sortase n=1 Tax=Bifidobacterium pseudocatenulatum TaxID=28026 RepID=UPI000E432893|nr:class C sortase [Bifidobacterium pseudocatenulatum]